MSDSLRIVRVFIGSPGGLADERQIAHEVVGSVNKSHSERWGILFKLMGWEDAVPGFVRPQSKINDDLDKCDYFIGVLWNQWGSKPSLDPGDYTSGFEEEYYRAVQRIEVGLMKDMAIYFKAVEVPPGMEPGKPIRQVLQFRQKLIDEKKVFFKDFSDGAAFKDLAREKLEEIGWRETGKDSLYLPPSDAGPNQGHEESSGARLIDEEGRRFLESLAQKPREWNLTASHEIARLRLLGSALGRSDNDEYYVGNHDANLLFRHYRDGGLSEQELQALVDCGIVGFGNQNVPLWGWLAKDVNDPWGRLRFLAVAGNEREKRYAIELLGLTSQPIPELRPIYDKAQVLALWFAEDASSQVFDAAIDFLSTNATEEDLELLEAAHDDAPPTRQPRIQEAIASVIARTDLDAALSRVVGAQVDKIGPKLLVQLLGDAKSIPTATAALCVSAKSETVRLRAVELLHERKELSLDVAQVLLTDSNHEIRLLAAESLKRLGVELDDEQLKKALQISKPNHALGFFSSIATDSTYYDRYQANRLLELDFQALRERAESAGVLDGDELSALYSKYGAKVAEEIRIGLRDRFKSHFESNIQSGLAAGYITPQALEKLRKLEEFARNKLTSAALSSLCKLSLSEDKALVRSIVDGGQIEASTDVVRYFGKHGEWSDIERIKALGQAPSDRVSLFEMMRTQMPDEKAEAIISIGKARIVDVLALDAAAEIRVAIVKKLSQRAIRDLRNEALLIHLNDQSDEFRVVFSLRCVESLPRSRISSLLNRYVDSSDRRYYNSIHWLDLGSSMTSAVAKVISRRALSGH